MRMEPADDVADHFGGLLVGLIRRQPQQPHGVKDAPMHRLKAVAGIGQGALGDGGQRVRQIALFERLAQVDDALVVAGRQDVVLVSH